MSKMVRYSERTWLIYADDRHPSIVKSPQMISTALTASFPPSLRSIPIFSVDALERYKPAREVYDALVEKVGKASAPEDVWLVSG